MRISPMGWFSSPLATWRFHLKRNMEILNKTSRPMGWNQITYVHIYMAMDQYLLIPFLVGWTSIYQLFWCSPVVQGFDTLPYVYIYTYIRTYIRIHYNNLSGLKSLESSPAATKKDSAGANTHGLTCFSVGKVTHHLKRNQEDNRLLQQAWPWCNECGRGPLCWVLQVPWVWIFFQLWKPWPVKVYYVFIYIYMYIYNHIYIHIYLIDLPLDPFVASKKVCYYPIL